MNHAEYICARLAEANARINCATCPENGKCSPGAIVTCITKFTDKLVDFSTKKPARFKFSKEEMENGHKLAETSGNVPQQD